MPTNIKIITDSASDVPEYILKQYDIEMLPLTVTFGDQSYQDRIELSPEEFYHKLAISPELPITSQVNPDQYLQAYEKYLQEGKEILVIGISSKLSGTLQSAQIAKDMLPDGSRIHIFDTRSASLGEGLYVIKAAELVDQGLSVEEILAELNARQQQSGAFIVLNSLQHLVRGGRLSRGQALVGSILSIKPILGFAPSGAVVVKERIRTTKRALQTIVERALETGIDFSQRMVAVVHANAPELAEDFAKVVQEKLKPKYVLVGSVGATIGTHAGSGGIGLFF